VDFFLVTYHKKKKKGEKMKALQTAEKMGERRKESFNKQQLRRI